MRYYEYSVQIWSLLSFSSQVEQKITKKMLMKLIGLNDNQVFSKSLESINAYCLQNQLPEISMLIDTNEFYDTSRIFDLNWLELETPQPEDFLYALKVHQARMVA